MTQSGYNLRSFKYNAIASILIFVPTFIVFNLCFDNSNGVISGAILGIAIGMCISLFGLLYYPLYKTTLSLDNIGSILSPSDLELLKSNSELYVHFNQLAGGVNLYLDKDMITIEGSKYSINKFLN